MPLLLCSPRLLLRLSPSHNLPPSSFVRPRPRLHRRSTALCAEPEPPLSTSAAEPPDAGDADGGGGEGPVELGAPTLFSVDENPTPLQTATSVLLTGAISIFLFRSLRRRARRTKELRVRSGGLQNPKNLSEEALEGLRLVSASPIETDKPPSPVQALLGGIAAGVIALILYKFTTTIEAALNRQTISDNFSGLHSRSRCIPSLALRTNHFSAAAAGGPRRPRRQSPPPPLVRAAAAPARTDQSAAAAGTDHAGDGLPGLVVPLPPLPVLLLRPLAPVSPPG